MDNPNRPTPALSVLPNGLKLLHIHNDLGVEYCGIAIRAGSRDELPGEEGIAHFVEHTIFKGTVHRRSSHIINRMERIGGELNAYTTKEETFVYSVAPAGYASRAIELIADLVSHSTFPENELDKEREVVADEIDSYLDSPSEAVYDDFEDKIFAETPLGHNILGTRETVASFKSESCRSFVARLYKPHRMVFFYSGNLRPEKVFRLAERYFASLPNDDIVGNSSLETATLYNSLPVAPVFNTSVNIGSHQAHTIMGSRICSLYSPERFGMALLNNILGGPGMNSRLNVALRERRGLVYTVESTLSLYSDAGLFSIYFGCNPEDLTKCHKIINLEIQRLTGTPLSHRNLEMAKKQYLGQTTVARASAEQAVMSAARAILFYGKPTDPAVVNQCINEISPDLLTELSGKFLSSLSSLSLL